MKIWEKIQTWTYCKFLLLLSKCESQSGPEKPDDERNIFTLWQEFLSQYWGKYRWIPLLSTILLIGFYPSMKCLTFLCIRLDCATPQLSYIVYLILLKWSLIILIIGAAVIKGDGSITNFDGQVSISSCQILTLWILQNLYSNLLSNIGTSFVLVDNQSWI